MYIYSFTLCSVIQEYHGNCWIENMMSVEDLKQHIMVFADCMNPISNIITLQKNTKLTLGACI